MNYNNLKTTVCVSSAVTSSILDKFVTRDQLGDLAYQNDVDKTAGYDEKKQYARKRGAWVEVESKYMRPEILEFRLPELKDKYSSGETITLTKIVHQESNLIHIENLTLYVKLEGESEYTKIVEVPAESEVNTHIFPAYSFVIDTNAYIKFEMETDIGNYFKKEFIIQASGKLAVLYTGISESALMSLDILQNELELKEFSTETKYKYQLSDESHYIWWCTNFELEEIKQDGLYEIDTILQSEKVILPDDTQLFCYRTREQLTEGTWRFTLVGDPQPQPTPEVLVGDLLLGGAISDVMTVDEISGLTEYDFTENTVFKVNLSADSFVWICCPYEIDIMDESGAYPDFIIQEERVTYKDKIFICYRSTTELVSGKWKFKFERT